MKSGKRAVTHLERLVPAASHDTAVVWGLYPVDCLDRRIMLNTGCKAS